MFDTLLICSGVCWTITYLLIIWIGFRDRTYGMPLAALCANLSWEFIFSFVHPHPMPQLVVNGIWLAFDVLIAAQVLLYGPREWRLRFPMFLGVFFVTLGCAFAGVLLVTREFVELDNWSGAYAAFGQNLMMSVLFVELLRNRGDLRGQHWAIALFKMIGTAFASIGFLLYTSLGDSPLMRYLFVSIFAFDLLYLVLVWNRTVQLRRSSRKPSPRVEECNAVP